MYPLVHLTSLVHRRWRASSRAGQVARIVRPKGFKPKSRPFLAQAVAKAWAERIERVRAMREPQSHVENIRLTVSRPIDCALRSSLLRAKPNSMRSLKYFARSQLKREPNDSSVNFHTPPNASEGGICHNLLYSPPAESHDKAKSAKA
jgi:hypothetical protein